MNLTYINSCHKKDEMTRQLNRPTDLNILRKYANYFVVNSKKSADSRPKRFDVMVHEVTFCKCQIEWMSRLVFRLSSVWTGVYKVH